MPGHPEEDVGQLLRRGDLAVLVALALPDAHDLAVVGADDVRGRDLDDLGAAQPSSAGEDDGRSRLRVAVVDVADEQLDLALGQPDALAGAEGAFDEILLPDLGDGFSWDTSGLMESGELRLLGPSPAVSILSFSIGVEGVSLEIDGPAGRDYVITTSTDLLDWQPVGMLVPASTPFLWTSPLFLPDPQRFYRVHVNP